MTFDNFEMLCCFNFNLVIAGRDVPVSRVENFGGKEVRVTKGLERGGMSFTTYVDDGRTLDLMVVCFSRDGKGKQYYYQNRLIPTRVILPELDAMKNEVLFETLILEER